MSIVKTIEVKTLDNKRVINELYINGEKENSLVVLFPGGNYSCDKPLLYYARKIALELGNNVLCVNYSKKVSKEDIGSGNVTIMADEVQKIIKESMIKKYKNIYFISKSIGTEIAGVIASKYGYENIKSLFLTPTVGTIKHIDKTKCTVIVGTSDGLFPKENINKLAGLKNIQLEVIEEANHSLEIKNDVLKSIDIIKHIVKIYSKFFCDK